MRAIHNAKLVIVGCGRNGGTFSLLAVHAGFNKITLIDPDRLEESNLNIWPLGGYRDVGELKVEVACRRLSAIRPDVEVEGMAASVQQCPEILAKGQWWVDAVDNEPGRWWVQEQAIRQQKPLFDLAAGVITHHETEEILANGSRLFIYRPEDDEAGCLACMGTRSEEVPAPPISWGSNNFVAAAMTVNALVQEITGVPVYPWLADNNLLVYGAVNPSPLRYLRIARNRDCELCSRSGEETEIHEE